MTISHKLKLEKKFFTSTMSPLVALESNKSGSMEAVDFTENNMNNLIEVF